MAKLNFENSWLTEEENAFARSFLAQLRKDPTKLSKRSRTRFARLFSDMAEQILEYERRLTPR